MSPNDLSPDPGTSVGSEKIAASHLERLAVVYVRQSTTQQVLEHGESTRLQYGLAERARTLGWPEQSILVIDDDLGKSGSDAQARMGFQRLVSEVSLDHVGIILGVEMSRLARSSKDWHQLLEICAIFDTLIADSDGIYNAGSYNDRLLLGLKGTMSEAELHMIKQRMHQGRINKARRGELSVQLPVGYSRTAPGEVILDPDEEVQKVVCLVFEKFEEFGTVNAVLKYLVTNGVNLGFRSREKTSKGELQWRPPTRYTLQGMLQNPVYAGAYAYGRRRVDPRKKKAGRPSTGYVTRPTPSEEWYALIKDRMQAYISCERYEKNVKRLAENTARSDAMGTARAGNSLLQGLLVCGRCGNRMNVRYSDNGRYYYFCGRLKTHYGGKECQHLSGPTLDEYIGDKVIEALRPAALELSLEAAGRVEQDREELDELWRKRLERASYEADRAGRHFRQIEPENRLVARQLARDWEQKLAAHQRLEEDYRRFQSETPKVLSDAERESIRRLSEDIPSLWEAQTTTNRDRKEIVRQIIERIVIDIEGDSERVQLTIRWAGGTNTAATMTRPVYKLEQLSYYPELCERLRELVEEGVPRHEIINKINAEGYRSPISNGPFGTYAIRDLLRRLGLTDPRRANNGGKQEPVLDEGEWPLRRLAEELGMSKTGLRRWITRGWVIARQEQQPPWRWIVWADKGELKRLREFRALPLGYHVRNKLWLE